MESSHGLIGGLSKESLRSPMILYFFRIEFSFYKLNLGPFSKTVTLKHEYADIVLQVFLLNSSKLRTFIASGWILVAFKNFLSI